MLTVIKANFRYNDTEIPIEFPCFENVLCAKLMELHAPENTAELFLSEMEYPSELSVLENTLVGIDELNFLAKRMDSFCGDKDLQLFEAMKLERFSSLKNLINLTFNLDKYTLIQNIGDIRKIGVDYTLNTQGSIPVDEADDPQVCRAEKEAAEIRRRRLYRTRPAL